MCCISRYVLAAAAALCFAGVALAQSAPVVYQGRLDGPGGPVNGDFDFSVELWTGSVGGTLTAGPAVIQNLNLENGLFSFELPFPSSAYDMPAVYLQFGVRDGASTGAFEPLSPRQQLGAAPIAYITQNFGPEMAPPVLSGVPGGYEYSAILRTGVADFVDIEIIGEIEIETVVDVIGGGVIRQGIATLRRPFNPVGATLLDAAQGIEMRLDLFISDGRSSDALRLGFGRLDGFRHVIADDGTFAEEIDIMFQTFLIERAGLDRRFIEPPTRDRTVIGPVGSQQVIATDGPPEPLPNTVVGGIVEFVGDSRIGGGFDNFGPGPFALRLNPIETGLDLVMNDPTLPAEIGLRLIPSGYTLSPVVQRTVSKIRVVPTDDGFYLLELDVVPFLGPA